MDQDTALFLFRRDLRLEDNLGLLAALSGHKTVIPAFIFDPRQTDRSTNEYFSEPAFSFLLASLEELDACLQKQGSSLYIFSGDPAEIVETLIKQDNITAVHCNKDYTPFARKRDKSLHDMCAAYDVPFTRHDDVTLSPIETIRTGQDTLYTVFTPFKKKAAQVDVPEPTHNSHKNYCSKPLHTKTVPLDTYSAHTNDMTLLLSGGRSEGLSLLKSVTGIVPTYEDTRNLPAVTGTSRLSAHHKFGTISVRETYCAACTSSGDTSSYISELYWRDFYYYIAYFFPIVFKGPFLPWAHHIEWQNDTEQFDAWCAGKTGVPMVDAAMRELNTTGWIHNRSRMIVASYLTKNLLIDWRWGERYFATKLIDYDPAQNNGGWQWSASTGADPRPLRIFNPYTQATKYDPEAIYIKHWVPELKDVPTDDLTDGKTQDFSSLASDYPAPLVDQKESYHRAMATYKKAKEAWKANN